MRLYKNVQGGREGGGEWGGREAWGMKYLKWWRRLLVWRQGEDWGMLRAADCGGACCRGGPGPWCPPVSWLSQPVSENSPASQTAVLRRLWGREERRGPLFSILILISISGSISLLVRSPRSRSFHFSFFLFCFFWPRLCLFNFSAEVLQQKQKAGLVFSSLDSVYASVYSLCFCRCQSSRTMSSEMSSRFFVHAPY